MLLLFEAAETQNKKCFCKNMSLATHTAATDDKK